MTIEDCDPGGGSQRQLFGGLRRGSGHCFNGGSSTGNNLWVHHHHRHRRRRHHHHHHHHFPHVFFEIEHGVTLPDVSFVKARGKGGDVTRYRSDGHSMGEPLLAVFFATCFFFLTATSSQFIVHMMHFCLCLASSLFCWCFLQLTHSSPRSHVTSVERRARLCLIPPAWSSEMRLKQLAWVTLIACWSIWADLRSGGIKGYQGDIEPVDWLAYSWWLLIIFTLPLPGRWNSQDSSSKYIGKWPVAQDPLSDLCQLHTKKVYHVFICFPMVPHGPTMSHLTLPSTLQFGRMVQVETHKKNLQGILPQPYAPIEFHEIPKYPLVN